MKYFSFCPFILALLFSTLGFGQNLVPNPSFEEYLECPQGTADFQTQVVDWYSWQETPDYFNACNNTELGTAGVPTNAWGYQYPVSGSAYAGLITYVHYLENGREYIACPIDQLTIGISYYVMFYVSNCDNGSTIEWSCATNHLGLKFFKDSSYSFNSNPYTPENTADIEFNEMFTDTTNWHLVEGWFTADQAYNWIALGNFYDDDHTDTLQLSNPNNQLNECAAVYYIDNVCISANPADCHYLLGSRAHEFEVSIDVYPNPTNGELSISSNTLQIENITVYSVLGKLIYQKHEHENKIVQLTIGQWASGIYIIEIELDDGIFYQTKILKK